MEYLKQEISVSNVENIVGQLSADWKGSEEWLNEFALKLNDRNKKLRDELRGNKNVWTHHQYKTRLAYHYYNISALFNELYMKHHLDVQSIVGWLEKCLELLGEIPASQVTTKAAKLSADAEEYLAKSCKILEALKDKRAKLETRKAVYYVSLSAALGDILGNSVLKARMKACETDERKLWLRKIQSLIMVRVIMFLEDSFTRRYHKNPLVTSNLLLSLGYAYETMGIPYLGERYQNTSEELLKSVLQSSSTTKDRKQNIKNIIAESVKDGTSLEHVCHTIEEAYTQPLSVIDQAYISRKYNMICLKQYIGEMVEFLQDQVKNNKDRRMIHEMLANLRSSTTLLQISHPLDQSVRYDLLKNNYHSVDKADEHKWMTILKKECFTVMIDYVNATKKELRFLEVFVDFLGLTKETRYLENKLNLHLVCTQDVPLGEIVRGVLDLDVKEFGEELKEVQAAAAPLKDEEILYYEDKFRDFIIDYFKPPKIRMVQLDGRNVLEVTGIKIVLSDVIREEPFKEILNDASCGEIRIVGGQAVHVDSSFSDSKWRGKNIVVFTQRIRVHGKAVWDVSGRDSTRVYASTAGQDPDGTGKQGEDGEAGESGGNVLVLVDTIMGSKNLTLISSGGNGSNGQDGGDGRNGQDGNGITKSDFESKFPPASKFIFIPRIKNTKTTLDSIRELGTVTYKWYERPVTDVSRFVPFGTFYKNVIRADSHCFEKTLQNITDDLEYSIQNPLDDHNRFNGNIFVQGVTREGNELEFCFYRGGFCQSYFLFKGAPGKSGSKGGEPGMGGQGGFGGEVILRSPNDPTASFDVVIETQPGSDGNSGKGGKYGKHGKDGCDMGYLDYASSSKWPKWYGQGGNSKVKLTYHVSSSSDRVWSPYRSYLNYDDKYVGMSSSGLDHHKSEQFDERATLSQNRERSLDAKATKKKTISQANVLSQYQHLLGSSQTACLTALFSQIDKTHQELLQSIAQTTASRFEVNAKAEFTRCTAYRKTGGKGEDLLEFKMKPKTDVKPRLVEDLKVKPMPLVAWKALGTMHLTKDEISSLVTVFDSLYATAEPSKIQPVREMFLEKYRFVMLNEISKKLSENEHDVITENIDARKAVKYLRVEEKETKGRFQRNICRSDKVIGASTYVDRPSVGRLSAYRTDEFLGEIGPNFVSHRDLGTLNQFLFINKEQEREKVVRYLTHTLKDFEEDLLDVFRAFVLALGDSSSSSKELKSCFNDYNRFLEKKDRGLIVFPESLERIDRKHSKTKRIIEDIKQCIKCEGCLTSPCIMLLAHIFNVNIRVYKDSCHPYEAFYLENDFTPAPQKGGSSQTWERDRLVHLLMRADKCLQMQVDWDYVRLDKRREMAGTQRVNILRKTKNLDSRESLEKYLACEEYLSESYFDDFDDDDDVDAASCMNKVDKAIALKDILKKFDDMDDQALLGTRLSKISNYVSGDIVESIHKKFLFEGRHVSVQELCCLINAVLLSAAEGNAHSGIYQWIISAYPQDHWIDQVLLMDLETFFKKALPSQLKRKWEGYLSKIKNKSILMRLREKLDTITTDAVAEKCVDDIIYMLSEIPGDFRPGELGLAEWPCALKEKYWCHKLTEIREWNDPTELSTHSYYLLSMENIRGDQLVKQLLELIITRKNQVTPELLTTIFCSFYNETWDLTKNELHMLETGRDVSSWVTAMKEKFLVDGKERDLNRLCQLVESNANTSEGVKTLLPAIRNYLNFVDTNRGFSSYNLAEAENDFKAITDYNESDISRWLKAFSRALKEANNDISKVKSNLEDIWMEMLDVVDSAIFLKRGFKLRSTQKLAVMILLKNENSSLAQVATGEGKSLIVVAVSIIEALTGEKVDIITSSSVLAKRDAEINQDIYNLLGINVSHNCSEDIEVRKASYSGNQVVYGDLSDFQRDYLLHEFYNINVLGDRKFETVVVDEVDSMLLDKGNNMLYLSHNIPGLDKLESVYLFIWQWISRPCGDRDSILQSMNAKDIRDVVIYDLYGTIRIEDVKALDVKMTYQQASAIWENLKKNNVIDELSRLKIDWLNRSTIVKVLSPSFGQYTDSLYFLVNECIFRDRQIHVPNCLKPFVDLHLDKWISNAINAFFMSNGDDYVVDVDRTGTSPDRNPNITIIDRDTGTDQSNSQWDEALHQFLQLKHGCKVSTLSLKAVFISNVSYFKQYRHLYGLSGTLGSQGERELLKEVHSVDFVTIPTAKPKQFHEYLPRVCYSNGEWKTSIKNIALDFINKKNRSVLIICHSVNDVENLHRVFGGEGARYVHTYTRDYEEFDITQSKKELGPGHIIIATNLAGRGTDIKIDNELKQAGGLHVIVAYLPRNKRIEQQAFGRAARCGEKGSGQLVIPVADRNQSKILNLKSKRDNDELERISEIRSFYENQIKVEEMCFGKFKEQFIELKNSITKASSLSNLLESAAELIPAAGEDLKSGATSALGAAKSAGEALLQSSVSAMGIDMNTVPKAAQDILLKSCINMWAFWLDRNSKFVKDWMNISSQNSLRSSLDNFLSQMKNLKVEDQHDWSEWLDNNPVSMVELAKFFLQKNEYDAAIVLLDKVIRSETHFAESAHYYKAAALGCKIDWESKPSESDRDVKKMKAELSRAALLFERFGSNAMTNAAVIGKMKHENQQSLIQVDAYEEQQKNIANLCSFFSGSISDILGHSVTPESFNSWNISDEKARTLYQLLLRRKLLTQPKVENISEADLDTVSCEYDIPVSLLRDFLNEHNGREITSFKLFKNALKNKIRLPSKEAFWKELVKMKILLKEVKYVIVKLEKLAEVDPSLLDTFSGSGCNAGTKRYDLKQEKNQIFLNSEQLDEQKKNTFVFEKQDFIKCVGCTRYAALKEREVLAFNRLCYFDTDLLKSAAESHPKTLTRRDLIAITDEDQSKSIINTLCGSQVIVEMDSTEEFRVLVNSDAIDKLFVSDNVKDLLKKYSGGPELQLSHYDSITEADLIRNRVSRNDAVSILQELERIKIIEKIPNSTSYRLTTRYPNIDEIRLNSPVYQNVTKSIMKMSFSYRIAIQKLASQVENGSSPKLHLKTKPHMDLLWSLHDCKVISMSQVRVGVCKEDVEKATSALDKRGLRNMLASSSSCLPRGDVEGLIENLVSSGWLIYLPSSEYRVEKDKGKRKPLDGCYSDCEKTVAKLLDLLAALSDDTTIASIVQCLDRMKSVLKALDVPSFGLKPLSEALSEGDFSMIQEMRGFLMGGLGELIVLKEKAYTFKFWVNVTCVVLLGICQIVVGAIIDIYSVGCCTYIGNAFISEGISDIMYAIGGMRTGYFSWKDYGRHKIESVALTIVSAGVGAYWSKGTKFSRVGQKLNPRGLAFGTKKVTEVTGAEILKRANASIAKEVAKTVVSKTIEAIAFGAANSAVDAVISNNLQSLSEGIASQILADLDQEVRNHKITSSLERAFRMKGDSYARMMVQELTDHYFAKTAEWETMCSWVTKISSSILNGFIQATAKKQNAGVQTTQADVLLQLTSKALTLANYAKDFVELRNMSSRMLDGLAKEIDNKLADDQSASSEFDEAQFTRFRTDIVDGWRKEIRKRSGDIVGQRLISPLMKDGAHILLRYAGRKVKDFYRKFKDQRCYQELLSVKKQYEDEIERVGDEVEARERIIKEYGDTLLKLAAKTRDPNVYADIILEDVPLDISSLHVVVAVLSEIRQSLGNDDGIKFVVEKDDVNQEFGVPGISGETDVIRLKLVNNHYVLLDDDEQAVPLPSDGSGRWNSCLVRAIAHKIDLGMSDGEFRRRLASEIRSNPKIHYMIKQGYHSYGISLGLYGGRTHPYEKPGAWEFDPKKDIDLLSYVNRDGKQLPADGKMSNEEFNKHLKEAFNVTLKKINEIVTGKSEIERWKNVKLLSGPVVKPEDFQPTMYDMVYTTVGFGAIGEAYFPVEMRAIIEVRDGQNLMKYSVEINLDTVTREQKGPQGPHVGYTIKPYRPEGEYKLPRGEVPKKVVGHCAIRYPGNDYMPRRALMSENAPGVYYVDSEKYKNVPKDRQPIGKPLIPLTRLFYGSATRIGSQLQRVGDKKGSTRNRSFPSPDF